MGIIVAIVIVGFVIFIHEFGHFIFAKLWNVSVLQFAIGWGPKIFSIKKRETEYRLNIFPLIGGYVKLLGEEDDVVDENEVKESKKLNLKRLDEITAIKRALIFAGGIILQLFTCLLILTLLIVCVGKPHSVSVVARVMDNSPAFFSGIKTGDIIIEADGKKIVSSKILVDLISKNIDKNISLSLKRENGVLTVDVTPKFNQKENRSQIGIAIADSTVFSKEGMKVYEYIFGGAILTADIGIRVLDGIRSLITRKISLRALVGPIGIVDLTGEVAKTGFLYTLLFFTLININLAIINALPIPACDGSHLLLLAIESVFRIRIKPSIKKAINTAGFALIILLFVYVSFNDLINLQDKYLFKR